MGTKITKIYRWFSEADNAWSLLIKWFPAAGTFIVSVLAYLGDQQWWVIALAGLTGFAITLWVALTIVRLKDWWAKHIAAPELVLEDPHERARGKASYFYLKLKGTGNDEVPQETKVIIQSLERYVKNRWVELSPRHPVALRARNEPAGRFKYYGADEHVALLVYTKDGNSLGLENGVSINKLSGLI